MGPNRGACLVAEAVRVFSIVELHLALLEVELLDFATDRAVCDLDRVTEFGIEALDAPVEEEAQAVVEEWFDELFRSLGLELERILGVAVASAAVLVQIVVAEVPEAPSLTGSGVSS